MLNSLSVIALSVALIIQTYGFKRLEARVRYLEALNRGDR